MAARHAASYQFRKAETGGGPHKQATTLLLQLEETTRVAGANHRTDYCYRIVKAPKAAGEVRPRTFTKPDGTKVKFTPQWDYDVKSVDAGELRRAGVEVAAPRKRADASPRRVARSPNKPRRTPAPTTGRMPSAPRSAPRSSTPARSAPRSAPRSSTPARSAPRSAAEGPAIPGSSPPQGAAPPQSAPQQAAAAPPFNAPATAPLPQRQQPLAML